MWVGKDQWFSEERARPLAGGASKLSCIALYISYLMGETALARDAIASLRTKPFTSPTTGRAWVSVCFLP